MDHKEANAIALAFGKASALLNKDCDRLIETAEELIQSGYKAESVSFVANADLAQSMSNAFKTIQNTIIEELNK